MSWLTLLLFSIGWTVGWVLLWRPRPLAPPRSGPGARPPVAVVVPARDEAVSLPALLASVRPHLRDGDELVVVDDHSNDATAALAGAGGARVVGAPPLLPGWTGKSAACHAGVGATNAPVLVFLDADVTLAPGGLDRVVGAATRPAAGLVSVQPWHAAGPRSEQASLFFNLVAVMAAGVAWPMRRGRRPVAFGPVLATTRENYLGCGGHAHPDVRASIVDDIALAGRYAACGQSVDVALDRSVASFRMYPGGGRPLLEGWTKNIAAGAAAVGPGAVLAVAVWIAALVGGPLASPWLVLATVPQVHLLGRRVGRFGVLTALLYPLPLALFVVVALRSGWRRAAGRPARWRGRSVPG